MATSLTLRGVKGSELTWDETDDNFTALRTTADAALPAADAVVISDTKATPVGADTVAIRDSEDSNAWKFAALEDLPGGGGGDMNNPMTAAGDVIVGGSSGTPARLAVGSAGQVLTVVTGAPAWAAPTGGMTNPMTTAGDIIVGGSSGTPGRVAAGSNAQVLTMVSGSPAWAAASGAGLDPLGLWDYWQFSRIGNANAAANDMFLGAAILSGTNSTAIPSGGLAGYNGNGVFLRSSTTANGGYSYQTSSLVSDYFGTISHKFRFQFLWRTSFTGRTVRGGFLDTSTIGDATDGAYFEISGSTCSAKTANNSTRTTNATTVTLSLDVAYTFDIDVNAAGDEVRFRVYAGAEPLAILDVTNTANIPTTSARAFGAGVVATESSTTASDIGILYGLGVGTVEAFTRVNGVQSLTPSALTVGQWTATAGDAQIAVDITALPSPGTAAISALYYRLDGGSAVLMSGTGTGVRNITGLTNATEYDVQVAAENSVGLGPWSDTKARTPVAAGGTITYVDRGREFQGFGTSQTTNFAGGAMASGNACVVCAIVPNARSISSVVGSDAVSFGTALYSIALTDQTHYYYARANCPALTGVTVTVDSNTSFDTVIYNLAGAGSSISLDDSDSGNYGSSTDPWEFAVTPSTTGTFFIANLNPTLDFYGVGVSPLVAFPTSSDYSIGGYAALTSSGLQTLEMNVTTNGTTPTTRAGDRSWIVLRAGA